MGNLTSRKVYIAKETYTPVVLKNSDGTNHMASVQAVDLLAFTKNDELVARNPPRGLGIFGGNEGNGGGGGGCGTMGRRGGSRRSSIRGFGGGGGVQEVKVNDFGEMFHYMKNLKTGKRGFVSSHYMAEKGSLECHDWYFGKIKRGRAECFLAQECNIDGSYLIRESDTKENCFSLSVKAFDSASSKFGFKHFVVYHESGLYFVSRRQKFDSLASFAEGCRTNCLLNFKLKLKQICQKPRPTAFNEIGNLTGNKWTISPKDVHYDKRSLIGKGNFGNVYKGTFRGILTVAVKTLKADERGADKDRTDFKNETKILQKIHHPNLVQVYGICTEESPFLMIVEYLEKGDLRNYLVNHKDDSLTFYQLLSICENIASGMQALEMKNIVHRDLAARNVLLDSFFQAKVGDFGLARDESEYSTSSGKKGNFPVKWTALEAIQNRVFTHKTDVWSFGITVWEVFTFGDTPYSHIEKNYQVVQELERGYRLARPKLRPSWGSNSNSKTENNEDGKKKQHKAEGQIEAVYNIMLSCWQTDPMKRPTFETLRMDFQDFDTAAEAKYDYSSEQVLEDWGLTNKATPSSAKRAAAGGGGGGGRRPPPQKPHHPKPKSAVVAAAAAAARGPVKKTNT